MWERRTAGGSKKEIKDVTAFGKEIKKKRDGIAERKRNKKAD